MQYASLLLVRDALCGIDVSKCRESVSSVRLYRKITTYSVQTSPTAGRFRATRDAPPFLQVAPIDSKVQSVLGRGYQEQERRRRVEHVEILVSSDSDDDGEDDDGKDNDGEDDGKEDISSSCSGASSTTAAAIPQLPKSREWDCKACTFRNSNTKGLACAVCSFKRV